MGRVEKGERERKKRGKVTSIIWCGPKQGKNAV